MLLIFGRTIEVADQLGSEDEMDRLNVLLEANRGEYPNRETEVVLDRFVGYVRQYLNELVGESLLVVCFRFSS